MDSEKMFELADKLKNLREQKADTEALLKEINEQIDETDYRLSEIMAETETQNFTRSGTMFCLTTKTRASAVAGSKEELYSALRQQGFGELVYETVNANSLSSFVKEQIEENGDALPDWLIGLVNVYDKTTVGVRKASK
jgi:vacuolar-type H+-ATPase subunit I/STV1